jgi:hypothetical protein
MTCMLSRDDIVNCSLSRDDGLSSRDDKKIHSLSQDDKNGLLVVIPGQHEKVTHVISGPATVFLG